MIKKEIKRQIRQTEEDREWQYNFEQSYIRRVREERQQEEERERNEYYKSIGLVATKNTKSGKNYIICLNDINLNENIMLLPCGHEFHDKCMHEWLKNHLTCPVCKIDLHK